jgi:hypothetical protein
MNERGGSVEDEQRVNSGAYLLVPIKPLTTAAPTVKMMRSQMMPPGMKVRMPKPRMTQTTIVKISRLRKTPVSGLMDLLIAVFLMR